MWLLRLIVRLEPLAFEERHRRALTDRRVTVVQGADGMGYVTGEVSAADAAAIDGMLAAAARSLGADDPRTDQQRRADLFADLLLGRLAFDDNTNDDEDSESDGAETTPAEPTTENTENTDNAENTDNSDNTEPADAGTIQWLEVEVIDPDTGELLGTQLQRISASGDAIGEPIGEPLDPVTHQPVGHTPTLIKRPRKTRIGVVVPLASLLGATDSPAELADRSGFIPGETLRDLIAETLDPDSRTEVLFTRLLTDNHGRLLDATELGRYASTRLAEAIKIRAGTCRFPTCTVPADRCDLDHHEAVPKGATSARNMDPFCRRHHRGKTFAWLAALRDDYGVDWTMPDAEHYRCVDEPLPTGLAA